MAGLMVGWGERWGLGFVLVVWVWRVGRSGQPAKNTCTMLG